MEQPNFIIRDRRTQSGIPIEKRIQAGTTLFFENYDLAHQQAKQIRSYVYPCFEDVKTDHGHKHTKTFHVGFCVPK